MSSLTAAAACCGVAAVGPTGRRYRSIAARPTPQQQMQAVPRLPMTLEAEYRLVNLLRVYL